MMALQPPTTAPLSAQTANEGRGLMWIYVLGERTGGTIKIGHTGKPRVSDRIRDVKRDQMSDEEYVLLAAVRSTIAGENAAHEYFSSWRQPRARRGSHKEYYDPAEPLIEWVLWLRQQWIATFDDCEPQDDAYECHPDDWIPKPERREPRLPVDPSKIVQDHTQLTGPLAGTAWDFMPDLTMSFQDYFTDPPIVAAACEAMGGIDLDAASHWLANRRLRKNGVVIGDYFHTNKSAFTHDWKPRVWLNPPYGENDQWFKRAIQMMDEGHTTQLCMLSPVYAFTTRIAEEIMGRSSAAVLLSPTPEFYNPGAPHKTGTNLPHAVMYWGTRRREFLDALADFGIPFMVAWSDVASMEAVA